MPVYVSIRTHCACSYVLPRGQFSTSRSRDVANSIYTRRCSIFIDGPRKCNSPFEEGQNFAMKLRAGEYTIEVMKPNGPTEKYGKESVFVSVWTQDCWNRSYSRAPSDGNAWTSGDCGQPVQLGVSWYDNAGNVQSALRNYNDTGARSNKICFRFSRSR